jgi:SAM-dependent methyltransferase
MSDGIGCWCGGREFTPTAAADYVTCAACGTTLLRTLAEQGVERAERDLQGYYEASYWHEHMDELGFPRVGERARLDLTERAQHWLRYLLRHVRPPSRVLEIGSASGAFVKLMQLAGFAATGMELSAQIVREARERFAIDCVTGPVEQAALPAGQFDAVALFDVLEHFTRPRAALRSIVDLLKPGGLLIVQTPENRPDLPADWEHYKAPEHTFLLTRPALERLFAELELSHFAFEPAIFPYDMFVFASRQPLAPASDEEVERLLLQSPDGRLVLAMRDLYRMLVSAQGGHVALRQEIDKLAADLATARGTLALRDEQLRHARRELDRLWLRLAEQDVGMHRGAR